ncbi:HAAS signaling domain-containing protein [Streptomyces sp. NPDC020883]|uniref:HAAS signaling domain-containing protein n=1 Tax=Streptomyces sp. NPDC020883 TaxID=3365099 RepID=UPI0037AA4081
MTSMPNQLIEDYLNRLDNASVFLADDRRAELKEEIREHINAALDEAGSGDEDAVSAVLERLGPPAEIVAAETPSRSTDPNPVVPVNNPLGTPKRSEPASLPRKKTIRFGWKVAVLGVAVVGLVISLLAWGVYNLHPHGHATPIPGPQR